ncbi:MAG: hypothetical protein ABIB61_04245 [Candidatus Shapirobacteria bacterium]
MKEIKSKHLKMRPRIYFIFESIILSFGFILAIFLAVFFINVLFFHLRMRSFYFPWLPFLVMVASIFLGFVLLKKYDFSYKKPFLFLVLALVGGIFLLGLFLNLLRVNERACRIKHLQPFYRERILERKPSRGL